MNLQEKTNKNRRKDILVKPYSHSTVGTQES